MDKPAKYDVSVVLAVFNEEESIEKELKIIKEAMDDSPYSYEVIVVDDASTDKTSEKLLAFNWVKILRHNINKGSGAARKTGTLAAEGELVVWTDADMSYPNKEIPRLVTELKERKLDQMIGMRKSEKGTFKFFRAPTKYLIRRLASFLAESDIPDPNSGLRVFKKNIAAEYLYLLPKRFSCASTITLSFLCNGYSVGFSQIDYHRRTGKSKFHPIKDTYNYIMQVIRMVMYFNPLKVFMSVSFLLFILAIVTSTVNIINTGGLQQMDIVIFVAAIIVATIGLLADLIVMQGRK
jgi:glycosyltransferase involved in cell wall biosynthesis